MLLFLAMFHIALYQPEIPPNTGNIIRLCANTGAQLHLIHPLGFSPTDAQLRRAGLDYHEWAKVSHHADWAAFLKEMGTHRIFAFSTKATKIYTEVTFQSGDVFLFGRETSGLPSSIYQDAPIQALRLPMQAESRSLNLSNTVAIALYEALRQNGFPDCL